jgi:hypothetical protein
VRRLGDEGDEGDKISRNISPYFPYSLISSTQHYLHRRTITRVPGVVQLYNLRACLTGKFTQP